MKRLKFTSIPVIKPYDTFPLIPYSYTPNFYDEKNLRKSMIISLLYRMIIHIITLHMVVKE